MKANWTAPSAGAPDVGLVESRRAGGLAAACYGDSTCLLPLILTCGAVTCGWGVGGRGEAWESLAVLGWDAGAGAQGGGEAGGRRAGV